MKQMEKAVERCGGFSMQTVGNGIKEPVFNVDRALYATSFFHRPLENE